MKTFSLFGIGCILVLASIQILLDFGGGIRGIIHRGQSMWYERQAIIKNDPGQCASIGDYLGQGRRDYLRAKCIAQYTTHIQSKNDCGTLDLLNSAEDIQNMDRATYYRQECLTNHYKRIFGNDLVAQWIPDSCTKLTEKFIFLSHYFTEINELLGEQSITHHLFTPMTPEEIGLVQQCEGLINTSDIYSYLRGEWTPVQEAEYIRRQKEKEETKK